MMKHQKELDYPLYSSIAVLRRPFAGLYHHVDVKACFLHPVVQDR